MDELTRGRPVSGRAFHYRDTGSPLHRLGAGWKVAFVAVMSAAAVAADGWLALGLLVALIVAGYRVARLSLREFWQDARWLALQGLLVVALSVARYGADGIGSGALTAATIALFFLPGALVLRTTPTLKVVESMRRVLPARLSFAIGTSMRFVPYFARELHDIAGAQRLRGARLDPRDLWRPGAWRDWIECVGVPMAVRAIHTANEAALAAEMRGIGTREHGEDDS
jgi:energy-coupling factor transporter transmembrane protein EcfT